MWSNFNFKNQVRKFKSSIFEAVKSVGLIFTLMVLFLFQSCGNKEIASNKKPVQNPKSIKSWEYYGKDTINRTDFSNNKQGHWEIRKPVACTKTIQAVYTGEPGVQTRVVNDMDWVKLEEGEYIDNKREGLWKRYYPSGRVKDSVIYKNNVVVNDFPKNYT